MLRSDGECSSGGGTGDKGKDCELHGFLLMLWVVSCLDCESDTVTRGSLRSLEFLTEQFCCSISFIFLAMTSGRSVWCRVSGICDVALKSFRCVAFVSGDVLNHNTTLSHPSCVACG